MRERRSRARRQRPCRKTDLGIYGLAVTLSSLVCATAPTRSASWIYPIFLRLYGQTRDPAKLRDHLEKPTAFMSLLVSISLGFSYLVLHLPVQWFPPDFLASIEIFRLLTVSIVFSCLAILLGFYLMAIDHQNWLVPLGAGAVAFNYFVGLFAIRHGAGLPGVAMVTAAGQLLHTTCVMVIAGRHMRGSVWRGFAGGGDPICPSPTCRRSCAGLLWERNTRRRHTGARRRAPASRERCS